jgi:MoaA/NifB/PqqE/SkfB family radical SAM enzyme
MKQKSINQGPTDATIAITYKCNSKCVMCNIWKENPQNELDANEYFKLPKSLKDINITGGEPFLRNDLIEIIQNITKNNPKARIVISSNGFLTKKIVDSMQKIVKINPKTCIAFSVDGMNDMHSKIRGIDNSYNMVLKTVTELKAVGINDIRLAFTASKENINHLSKVYDLAKSFDVEFTLSVVHNSGNFFNIDTNKMPDIDELQREIRYVINREYRLSSLRRLFRTYYMQGILDFAETGKRPLSCLALKDFFFMDSTGNIFPCNMINTCMGNIRDNDFDTIWNSSKTKKIKEYCKSCNDCWMVCTAKSSIRRNFVKVSGDITRNYILNFCNI